MTFDTKATITASLWRSAIDAPAVAKTENHTAHGAPPALHGNEGLVLSALLRQVFVIPAPVGGRGADPAGTAISIYDYDAASWFQVKLSGSSLPGAVLDGFYRVEDGSLYVVDNEGDALRLFRMQPRTGVVTLLGTMPKTWFGYAHVWLTQGNEGDLLLTLSQSSNSGSRTSLIARFNVEKTGFATFAGMVLTSDPTLARPHLGPGGVTRMAVDAATGAKLSPLAISTFKFLGGGDTPVMAK